MDINKYHQEKNKNLYKTMNNDHKFIKINLQLFAGKRAEKQHQRKEARKDEIYKVRILVQYWF